MFEFIGLCCKVSKQTNKNKNQGLSASEYYQWLGSAGFEHIYLEDYAFGKVIIQSVNILFKFLKFLIELLIDLQKLY